MQWDLLEKAIRVKAMLITAAGRQRDAVMASNEAFQPIANAAAYLDVRIEERKKPMPFYDLSRMEFRQKREGVRGKVITGALMQMAYVHAGRGVETNHSHPSEQIGYILSGEVQITIEGEKRICAAGDAYLIPGGVQHGFKPLSDQGVEYLEIFSPPKEENR